MIVLKTKIKKEEIRTLPIAAFDGRIKLITTEEEAEKAVNYLTTFPLVGIDSETKPSFTKGHVNKVSLLQISTQECCFLFRLNRIGMPASLTRFLEDKQVCKVGLSLHDDFMMLHKRATFKPQNYVELQDYAEQFGIRDKSLQKLYANLFHQKISKSKQLSNWEAEELTPAQQLYAATDAWACYRIYQLLEHLKETGEYEVLPEPEPEPESVPVETTETPVSQHTHKHSH